MDSWAAKGRGWGNRNSYRGVWRPKSSPNRSCPPLGPLTVLEWEKYFCAFIGFIPWYRILEAKKSMHLYQHIVNWNDTAAEEAFDNAKNRFWARIHCIPWNVKLPDPDIYIDKVDWDDASIDHDLYLDLETQFDMRKTRIGSQVTTLKPVKPQNPNEADNAFPCNDGELGDQGAAELPKDSDALNGWSNRDDDDANKVSKEHSSR